jgi:hypothetical protein
MLDLHLQCNGCGWRESIQKSKRRRKLISTALKKPPALPPWFAKLFSQSNPHAATTSNIIALRALLIERPHLLPMVPAIELADDEILIREFVVTKEQFSELMSIMDTEIFVQNFAGAAWAFVKQFADAIGCRLEATPNGWVVYDESVREKTIVTKFLKLVN